MDWKLYLKYYLTTAHGLITTLLGVGFIEMLFTGNELFFSVFLAAWLLRDARHESPAVVVVSKEQYEKFEEPDDNQ
ncbi:MAG: hypothetical protein OQK13_00305 [Gammaproteobacteria bacterium]|nr:hypothetical protein [Gammaproteobacteria bacterium]